MKQVLLNVALFSLIDYCLEKGIDCSGTHVRKAVGRGYRYELMKDVTGLPIAHVTFGRSIRPIIQRVGS